MPEVGPLEQLADKHENLKTWKEPFKILDQEVSTKYAEIESKMNTYKKKGIAGRVAAKVAEFFGKKNEPTLTPDQFKAFKDGVYKRIHESYNKLYWTVERQAKPGAPFESISEAMENLRKELNSFINTEIRLAAAAAEKRETPAQNPEQSPQTVAEITKKAVSGGRTGRGLREAGVKIP